MQPTVISGRIRIDLREAIRICLLDEEAAHRWERTPQRIQRGLGAVVKVHAHQNSPDVSSPVDETRERLEGVISRLAEARRERFEVGRRRHSTQLGAPVVEVVGQTRERLAHAVHPGWM